MEALKESADLKAAYDGDKDVRELLDIAIKLEGTNRNAGTHAAGVVIANGPLTDYVPLQRVIRKGDDGSKHKEAVTTTQWVMGDIEKVGLLKMDFLGLRTLTLLDNCVRLIRQTRGIVLDLQKLPLDDPETYALLQRGDARGVFQLESDGIRELLKRMRPDNIRDIIALMALYRPGPLEGGMVEDYINVKHGRQRPSYAHPVLEEVLRETYGVMVYQEQIMRILNRLGGIELSSAYACIKAISKKKFDIIDQRRAEFVKGAQERGLDRRAAEEIFELIVKFGGYGFNKSHTAAYAHIGYQTAYLKTHFTPEFMAALLSSEIDDGNKRDILVQHIDDARRLGVEVLAPNVNASESEFSVYRGKIVFGLTAIKGCGRGASEEIARVRDLGGRYKDLYDLSERVDHKVVPRSALEKLIKAGALDSFGAHRAQLLAILPRALQAADERQTDRRLGQRNLFDAFAGEAGGGGVALAPAEPLPDVPPWSETEKLKYEKEVLDFYFSSHPLAQHVGRSWRATPALGQGDRHLPGGHGGDSGRHDQRSALPRQQAWPLRRLQGRGPERHRRRRPLVRQPGPLQGRGRGGRGAHLPGDGQPPQGGAAAGGDPGLDPGPGHRRVLPRAVDPPGRRPAQGLARRRPGRDPARDARPLPGQGRGPRPGRAALRPEAGPRVLGQPAHCVPGQTRGPARVGVCEACLMHGLGVVVRFQRAPQRGQGSSRPA